MNCAKYSFHATFFVQAAERKEAERKAAEAAQPESLKHPGIRISQEAAVYESACLKALRDAQASFPCESYWCRVSMRFNVPHPKSMFRYEAFHGLLR